jgi:hypothetical protein
MKQAIMQLLARLCRFGPAVAFLFVFVLVLISTASATTDITGVVSAVSGYWDAVVVVSVGILLFVIGRRVVRKL